MSNIKGRNLYIQISDADSYYEKSKISKLEKLMNLSDNYYFKFIITGFAIFIAYLFYLLGYSFIYGYYFGGDEIKILNPFDIIISQIPFDIQYISSLGVIIFIITLIIILIMYNIVFSRGIKRTIFIVIYAFILYSLYFLFQFIELHIAYQLLNLLLEGSLVVLIFILFVRLVILGKNQIKGFLIFLIYFILFVIMELKIAEVYLTLAIFIFLIMLEEYLLKIITLLIILILLMLLTNFNLYILAIVLMFYIVTTYKKGNDKVQIENIIKNEEYIVYKKNLNKIKLWFEKNILRRINFTRESQKTNKDKNDIINNDNKKLLVICTCIMLLIISLLSYILLFSLMSNIGNKIGREVSLNKLNNITYYMSNSDDPVTIKGIVVKQLASIYYISTEERELKIISSSNIIISPVTDEEGTNKEEKNEFN